MSTKQKVELVASARDEYGLSAALAAVGLAKSSWYYQQQRVRYAEKYQHLRPLLEQIVGDHPSYGIMRITRELHETYSQLVNHKVIQRLLQGWDLSLLRRTQAPQPSRLRQTIVKAGQRVNLVAQLEKIAPCQVAYTDFTQLRFANGGRKAYLMPIIDHGCKLVYGWALGLQANTALALEAWQLAKQSCQRYGIPYQGMIVHHDQDSVYTSYDWTGQLLLIDKVQLSYALNGAKDNTVMESFNSRFKAEGRSLFLDAADLNQLRTMVAQQIDYYNAPRRHSSLDYLSPLAYLKKVQAEGCCC